MNRKRVLIVLVLVGAILAICIPFFLKKTGSKNELVLYGNVDVRQVDLGFRVFGKVAEMAVEEGDLVQKGQYMGCLDKEPYLDQVHVAEAAVLATKRQLINAEEIFKRRKKVVGAGAVSEENYTDALSSRDVLQANLKQAEASLEVANTNLHDTELFAPETGTILARVREPGAVVLQSEPIYTLSILSPVWIRAFVSEPQLGLIYPGMEAEIYTDSLGVYKGKIGFISPVAEFTPKTVETTSLRTDLVYRIRVYADNPDYGLRQGMPVTVKLKLKGHS
jgi:HlyD family secretion protein